MDSLVNQIKLSQKKFILIARRYGFWAGAIALAASIAFHASSQLTRTAPRLEVSTYTLDLGESKPRSVLSGLILISNPGSAPLVFNVATSCGCTSVEPRQKSLSPSEDAELRVSLTLPADSGSEQRVILTITCNDPDRPNITCVVSARSRASLRVYPEFVDFGRIDGQSMKSASASVQVIGPADNGFRFRHRLLHRMFESSLVQSDQIRLIPKEELKYGDYSDVLEITREGVHEETVLVPIRLHVTPPFEAIPRILLLRRDRTGRILPVEWIMVSNSRNSPLGAVLATELPPEFRIEEIARIGSHRARYRLTIDNEWNSRDRLSLELSESSSGNTCLLTLVVPKARLASKTPG